MTIHTYIHTYIQPKHGGGGGGLTIGRLWPIPGFTLSLSPPLSRVFEAEVEILREEERQLYEGAEALGAERIAAVAAARAEEGKARSLTEALESGESRNSQVRFFCDNLSVAGPA